MAKKTTTVTYQFSKQELIDALLIAELPDIVVADISDISLDVSDNSFFNIVLSDAVTVEDL